MKNKSFFIVALTIIGALFLTACSDNQSDNIQPLDINNSGNIISLDSMEVKSAPRFDWGDINISGGDVEKTFAFQNSSEEDLVLKGALTSCTCTTATYILPDDSISPAFGMHKNPKWTYVIKPKEKFQVRIVYDPMFHGPNGTGKIMRTASLFSSAKVNGSIVIQNPRISNFSITDITVEGNVLKEEDYNKRLESESKA